VEPLTEAAIRGSFVNCSKGEAARIKLPAGFADGAVPWADLDFLGWTDPSAPLRSLLVVPGESGPTGLMLRRPEPRRSAFSRSSMCKVCLTGHGASGVALFVAPLAGPAGGAGGHGHPGHGDHHGVGRRLRHVDVAAAGVREALP